MDLFLNRRQVTGWLARWQTRLAHKFTLEPRQRKQLLIALGALLLLTGSLVGYRYYLASKRQAALELFKECADLYRRALSSEKSDQWVEVEAAAKAGELQAGGTGLKPYFLMYQAQALRNQDRLPEAQALLKQAVDGLSGSSPVYNLYQTAYALSLVDSGQITVAIALLQKLSAKSKANNRDTVLFYLGELYNRQGQTDLAKTTFQLLIKEFKVTDRAAYGFNQESAWVRTAEERLSYL